MKKLLIAALVTVSLETSAFAAPATGSEAVFSFLSDFRGATNVTWKLTADYYKASFMLENIKMEAFYDPEGNIIATAKTATAGELPENARSAIAKKYCRYTVNETVRMNGSEVNGWYLSMESPKQILIVKVDDSGNISPVKRTLKPDYNLCSCEE